MKNALLCILLSGVLLPQSAGAEGVTADGSAGKVSLTLRSVAPGYDFDDVVRGAVEFRALIENRTDAPLTVAHPSACIPPGSREGQPFHVRERHGKSEILLTVHRPEGDTVVLRDGLHFFEPGNIPVLTVQPGGTAEFSIGWFFQHSRMIWEDGRLAEKLFLEKGPYRVSLLFRNTFPQAMFNSAELGSAKRMSVWTGELRSNEVSLEVR